MNILFLSHTHIGSPFVVGSHQLANQIAALGHRVLHVSHPLSSLHQVFGRMREGAIIGKINRNLHQIIPKTIVPTKPFGLLLAKNPFARSIARQVTEYANSIAINYFDLCFIDDPSFSGVETCLNIGKVIYRPTDVYKCMEGGRTLRRYEHRLINISNGVVATNRNILKALKINVGPHNDVIENGFDFDHFTRLQNATDNLNVKNYYIGGYVGAVDHRFSVQTIETITSKCKNIEIHVYSPQKINTNNCRIKWLGKLDYSFLPDKLNTFDFLIMPFNKTPANYSRSPMKLYEYASTNLPILMPGYIDVDKELDVGIFKYSDDRELVDILENFNYEQRYLRNTCHLEKHSWKNKAIRLLEFSNVL